ncbi:MAG: nucleoside-diphosphate kinase [Patescibacteria group bacterium]|nr:nucleoside-diphosphate kinase [Patescibacteria group bacterium]
MTEIHKKIKQERTLVLVKPDGVKRGLVGEVTHRIEKRGLKVVGLKMVQVGREHLENHFPKSEEWVERLGNKTLKTFTEYQIDPVEAQGTADPKELGKMVKESLFEYLQSGPVVAMVIEGIHAIDMVRKLAGNTLPVFAEMGTIRGDYSVDSPSVANVERRAIHNIMHASETQEEAGNEISLWFKPEEIHDYKRAEEDIMF